MIAVLRLSRQFPLKECLSKVHIGLRLVLNVILGEILLGDGVFLLVVGSVLIDNVS